MGAKRRTSAPRPTSSARPVILYVDDDTEDRQLFAHAARRAGVKFQVQLLGGYYEAIDYLRGHDQYSDRSRFPMPKLILLDYWMASFRGSDFLKWISNEKEFAKLGIAMFSGTADPNVVAECYALGARAYLLKPTLAKDLREIVLRLDGCLRGNSFKWSILREIAEPRNLSSEEVASEFRELQAKNLELREQQRELLSRLDLTLAEQKEVRKKFPYVRRRPPGRQT